MINIIEFEGGLGNQMFQYAMYLKLHHIHRFSLYMFDTRKACCWHNGFELGKIFYIDTKIKERLFEFFLSHFNFIFKHSADFHEIVEQKFTPEIFQCKSLISTYKGFWQTEKYFDSIRLEIKKAFNFRTNILNKKTKTLWTNIYNLNTVSIHIRRGDYLFEDRRNTINQFYYSSAISYINSRVEDIVYLIFSDDTEYVQSLETPKNSIIIDWNNGNESWQDMFLMTQCKHNIIANSTFSWWGAWLNENAEKIVIAPKLWIKGLYNEDIVPDNWIRL